MRSHFFVSLLLFLGQLGCMVLFLSQTLSSDNALALAVEEELENTELSEESRKSSENQSNLYDNLPEETITRISSSRKTLLLTNTNNSYQIGDYLTLIINDERLIRTICAKLDADQCGLKIVQVYNQPQWELTRRNISVRVLRGDDSLTPAPKESSLSPGTLINDESDLYNDSNLILDEDSSFDSKNGRILKNDHILNLSYSQIEGLDNDGSRNYYGSWMFGWSYQPLDNVFVEGLYGYGLIADFPAAGLDTRIQNLTARLKYVIPGPFYTFFMPYVGYQSILADSPDAGISAEGVSDADLEREVELLNNTRQTRTIFGLSLYKRLVPGWFLKADIGKDAFNAGMALEF